MRIHELIIENNQIDEISLKGIGQGLGKAAGAVGGAVSGIKGAWQGAKDAYAQGAAGGNYDAARAAVSGVTPAWPPAGYSQTAPTNTASAPAAAPAPTTSGGDTSNIMQAIDKLDKPTKQQLAGELEKSIASTPDAAPQAAPASNGAVTSPTGTNAASKPTGTNAAPAAGTPAAPQGQSLDLDQLKKEREAKLAAGQAGQQQAQQQMAATQQANAVTNQQDASIKAAADAAKAKSGFQQTAADKLAIKAAADKGIREAKKNKLKKKKKIAEFKSNFLGMVI